MHLRDPTYSPNFLWWLLLKNRQYIFPKPPTFKLVSSCCRLYIVELTFWSVVNNNWNNCRKRVTPWLRMTRNSLSGKLDASRVSLTSCRFQSGGAGSIRDGDWPLRELLISLSNQKHERWQTIPFDTIHCIWERKRDKTWKTMRISTDLGVTSKIPY